MYLPVMILQTRIVLAASFLLFFRRLQENYCRHDAEVMGFICSTFTKYLLSRSIFKVVVMGRALNSSGSGMLSDLSFGLGLNRAS